jgi:hypothetical protein
VDSVVFIKFNTGTLRYRKFENMRISEQKIDDVTENGGNVVIRNFTMQQ